MWVFERDTLRFLAVNEAAVRHYGYSRQEFLAMTAHDIRPPEEIGLFEAARDATPTSARASGRFRHRKKDGTVIDVEIAHDSLEYGGRAARLVVVNDVTERKLLEAQLRQAQKMEAVGRLAGGIAHDFNNLLTVILSHASLAGQDAAAGTDLAEDLTEISAAGKRAAELTRQLLTFARRHVSEPRVLDVNQVASGVDRMLRRLIGEDVALVTNLAAGLWSVRADPGQLEQVLVNLAVNARDAMPHGGTLTIATQNVQVGPGHAPRHPQLAEGDYVLLSVSDTGHGIAAEDLPYVFEPFFTTKAAGVGTGLGLATCYGIVQQHGGQIVVSSPPGRGATFDVYLPRVAGVPETGAALTSAPTARGSETILVVEDDPAVRTIAVRALGRLGYTTIAASDGAEGLEVAAKYPGPIDLLLTDVIMPHISGRELAVRLAERRPGIRVLYTSGYTQNVIAQHGVLDPGLHFLAKPYIPGTLLEKVREVLDSTQHSVLGTEN
jgi:two-component system, cell cycle sensor histidine kinase and response regulator CckA